MDQDRRSFLKSAGYGVATFAATIATPPSIAAAAISDGGKLSELNRLDATELASRIAKRNVSPVEVIEFSLGSSRSDPAGAERLRCNRR